MSDLLPPPLPQARTGWQMTARAWAWRLRFPVAAALTALAVLAAAGAWRPAPSGSVRVVVTAHDVTGGHTLAASDLRYVTVPASAAPRGATASVDDLVGRSVVTDLPAGVPVAAALLGSTPHGPPGTVVATVRLADPQMAALLSPGDRVDVLAAPAEGGPGVVVAHRAVVLPAPPQASGGGGLLPDTCGETGTTVVLAVGPQEVYALSGAAGSALSAFVVS